MKRLPFILLGIVALMLAATGCKNSSQKPASDSTAHDTLYTPSGDTLVVDSLGYETYNADSTIHSSVSIDFPRGNDSFSKAVKECIGRELAKLYVPFVYDGKESLKSYPRYKGDVKQGQNMVDYYGKGAVKYLAVCQKEMGGDGLPQVCSEMEIKKIAETSTYVTYLLKTYCEVGGPHGDYIFYCINISKFTNKPIDKSIDESKTRALQKILLKGLRQYFEGDEEEIAEVRSYLHFDEDNNGIIPLPSTAPYLDKDSLCFLYQQEEIAPHAAGVIEFAVAYKDIKPYLRQEVKDLVEKK